VSTYVVTGAAGFIGSHLAEALLSGGHEIVGIDCFTDYYDPVRKEENAAGLPVVRTDLAGDALDFDGVDGVFHLAGQPGVRGGWGDDFELYVRRNLLASQRVFAAAERASVRVVFASSSSVYGDAESYPTPEETVPRPISPYGITKLACEHLASARAGLDAVALRYFTVYGPRQRPDMAFTRIVEALGRGDRFELYGDGSISRSFTYVTDAVEATILAMERGAGGSVYNVGGGEEASMLGVLALAEDIAGRQLDAHFVAGVRGDVKRTRADVSRAGQQLGWRPRTTLADGLSAQWEWASARLGTRST
jgi:nucleoside-diphosphate-sugar epimerase